MAGTVLTFMILATGCAGPTARVVEYRPGVRIDWSKRHVELDAEVILREGVLELLACRSGTKEHESILRIPARPLHIYEALGLIGLTPGAPASWDEQRQRVVPASGDRLELFIRYRDDDRDVTVPAHTWLWDADKQRGIAKPDWVFAGSRRLEDGTMYADVDGTVVTVVDFASALISLPTSHSADNAELWLEPFTKRIPAEGTRCVLIVRAPPPPRVEVLVDRHGRLLVRAKPVSVAEVVTLYKEASRAGKRETSPTIRILADASAPFADVAKLRDSLQKAAGPSVRIELAAPASRSEAPSKP